MVNLSVGTKRRMFLDLGIAKDLYDLSMIDPEIINQYEIYKFVQLKVQAGVKRSNGAIMASEYFRCSERQVWRALSFFK